MKTKNVFLINSITAGELGHTSNYSDGIIVLFASESIVLSARRRASSYECLYVMYVIILFDSVAIKHSNTESYKYLRQCLKNPPETVKHFILAVIMGSNRATPLALCLYSYAFHFTYITL